MAGLKKTVIDALRRRSARSSRVDATIRVTAYGVEVELADGPGRTFLQSELTEPALETGIRWAREHGAAAIRIEH